MLRHNDVKIGDLVKVDFKILESGKERSTLFEGVVISIRGKGEGKTITIRRVSKGGIAVERIFPLSSPNLVSITVKKQGRTRRAKLYYLRRTKS